MSRMKRILSFFEQGTAVPATLVASALIGLMIFTGLVVAPTENLETAMRIEPSKLVTTKDKIFTIEITVESGVPVNVFAGELNFDSSIIKIESIDYNTSIADLWAELPWYSNGEGTLNFGGGTTQKGGFQGSGSLITVTFKTLREGDGVISIKDPRILLHDGLGTDTELQEPIDAIITIENKQTKEKNLIVASGAETSFAVLTENPSTDLNNDGKQTVADISIFMLKMSSDDARYDFNLDGKVNLKDLNVLLGAK